MNSTEDFRESKTLSLLEQQRARPLREEDASAIESIRNRSHCVNTQASDSYLGAEN